MKITKKVFSAILGVFLAIGSSASSGAEEMAEAIDKAGSIVKLLNEKKYSLVWDDQVSSYFKAVTTKDQFVANMAFGRAALGPLTASSQVGTEFFVEDPNFGYRGKGFAVTLLNTYGVKRIYERLVVVQDKDGQFRLGGIMAAPAPADR